MVNSRAKGKVGERQARDAAKRHWFAGEDCIRAAQANGKFSEDLLNALPGFHVEVKWYRKIAVLKWMRRALLDSKGGPAVVMMRENNDTDFYLLLRMSDSAAFLDTLWHARHAHNSRTSSSKPTTRPASVTTPAVSADPRTTSPCTLTGTPTASRPGADSILGLTKRRGPSQDPGAVGHE